MTSPGSTPPPGWSHTQPPQSRLASAIVWALSIGSIVFLSVAGYHRLELSRDPTYYAVGYSVAT
jgi:hypothetical protein